MVIPWCMLISEYFELRTADEKEHVTMVFLVWICISPDIIFSRYTHLSEKFIISFFFRVEYYSIVYLYHIFLMHSSFQVSISWPLWIGRQWALLSKSLQNRLRTLLIMYQGDWLGHMVIYILCFWVFLLLISRVTTTAFIPTNSEWVFVFPRDLVCICCNPQWRHLHHSSYI